MSKYDNLDPRTLAAQALGWEDPSTGAVVPPVQFATTFTRLPDHGQREYF